MGYLELKVTHHWGVDFDQVFSFHYYNYSFDVQNLGFFFLMKHSKNRNSLVKVHVVFESTI